MYQCKIFSSYTIGALEDNINQWLHDMQHQIEITQIQFYGGIDSEPKKCVMVYKEIKTP